MFFLASLSLICLRCFTGSEYASPCGVGKVGGEMRGEWGGGKKESETGKRICRDR